MDKKSYIEEVRNFVEQYLDGNKFIDNDTVQYTCILCGRSKNNEPHMRVVYNGGFYYCFRCNEGGILYNLIKRFKNSNNKEYVNNLLKLYFSFYEYDPTDKKIQSASNYNSYEFSLDNLSVSYVNEPILSDIQSNFFHKRFPNSTDDEIKTIIKKFKIHTDKGSNKIFYNSYYRKFVYAYDIKEDISYKKEKFHNNNIINDKKDYYYLISNYDNNNLYISEGLFDLITLFITDPLYNSSESNFLALCCRNYKFLLEILLNSGKFFYNNIYIIVDNDINEKKFISGIIETLTNNKNSNKYKLYNNLYKISVPMQFTDLNEYYLEDKDLKNLLISKIH